MGRYYYKKICVSCKEVTEQGIAEKRIGHPFDTVLCRPCVKQLRRKVTIMTKKYGWKCYLFLERADAIIARQGEIIRVVKT